ncbi:MAG: mechanosensitive ion channel family protein, partial [Thiohalomonadales bacterium]
MDVNDLIIFYEKNANWILQIFLLILAAVTIDFVQRRILKRVAIRLQKTPNLWDDALVESLRTPLSLLIWVIGVTSAIKVIISHTDNSVFGFVDPLRNLFVVIIIAWFVIKLITQTEKNIILGRNAKGETIDVTTLDAIAKLLRLSVMITTGLVALQTMGFSVSGVLAFGGVGGIAVGFAARDMLANFFGGLMIYLDRPFSVGDWIRSPDREIEGTVENIGWRLTVIRTFSKRPLYIPNAMFASIAVENPSRMSNRRIYETIGIRYDDIAKMQNIVEKTAAMLKAHPDIDTDQTLMVNFNSFAPSSLDFFIYTFTKTTDWQHYHDIKQDVLLKVYQIIDDQKAEVAFPTSTVHLPEPMGIP